MEMEDVEEYVVDLYKKSMMNVMRELLKPGSIKRTFMSNNNEYKSTYMAFKQIVVLMYDMLIDKIDFEDLHKRCLNSMNIGRDNNTIIRSEDIGINAEELFKDDDWIFDIKLMFVENITQLNILYENDEDTIGRENIGR